MKGNFYHQNAEEDLSFLGTEQFDMIYSFGVIHHSPNPTLIINNAHNLLKKIKGEKSIIYVSNSLLEVEQAHDRILVFKDGRIIMDGNLDKLPSMIILPSLKTSILSWACSTSGKELLT